MTAAERAAEVPPQCSECARSKGLCLWHQYEANRYRYGGWRAKALDVLDREAPDE